MSKLTKTLCRRLTNDMRMRANPLRVINTDPQMTPHRVS